MWTQGAYARQPFAAGAGTESPAPPGQQQIPPPLPGGTTTFLYQPHPIITLGWRSYAGRQGANVYPGGGVSIAPDPERGVMQVTGWWPDAEVLQFHRQHQDGSMYRVRTAAPLTITQATRRNFCTNPNFEKGLNGYVPDAGNPALTPIGDAVRGDTALRATIASAGACGVTIPHALTAGKDITEGIDLRFSHRPTGVTLQISWTDSTGAPITPASTQLLTANQINQSVSQWARQVVTITTPPNGVNATVKVVAAGLPAAGYMDVDGVTLERGSSDGSFFDGNLPTAVWLGVPGFSVSVLAPMLTIEDGECPTDVPVRYIVANLEATGGTMTSAQAVLESRGVTWMTHPRWLTQPIRVTVAEVPKLTRKAPQGKFRPIGGRYAIVVSAANRQSPDGQIKLWARSWEERDLLLEMFDDLSPVLVRAPGDYHFGDRWLSLEDMDEDAEGRLAFTDVRSFTANFSEVLAPSEIPAAGT